MESLYYWGTQLWLQQDLEGAITLYKSLVRNFPATLEARLGLVRIAYWYRKGNINGLSGYLSNLIIERSDTNLIGIALDLLVDVFQYENDFDNAAQTAEYIIQISPNTGSEYIALFNLFNNYHNELFDDVTSDSILTIMKDRYPDYELTLMAQFEMGESVDWNNSIVFETVGQQQPKTLAIPTKYSLGHNYPNPFNPVTTIFYRLPQESKVVLKIYDLMGREINTLNKTENAGFKNVMWDSKDKNRNPVSSGMYFYGLYAVSKESDKEFHETKKMVLIQ